MNVRNRALSSTPAMPTTRFLLNLEIWNAACAMASSGLVTTMMMQFGECFATCSVAVRIRARQRRPSVVELVERLKVELGRSRQARGSEHHRSGRSDHRHGYAFVCSAALRIRDGD